VDIIPRINLSQEVEKALTSNPIVVLQGPRQCGKTTLARQLNVPPTHYFDLDDPFDQIRLEENARTTLSSLSGLIIIDEAQRKPDLFPLLRFMADRPNQPARFLLLGSSSSLLLKQVSESLAGRAQFIDMTGLMLHDVGTEHWQDLWIKGSFPRAFQQASDISLRWRMDYLQQFVNRDLRDLGETKLSDIQVRRLLQFIAASNGQAWNHSNAGKTIGVNYKTIQRHLELFRTAFIVRELSVYDDNTHKRLRKAPTIYLRDSGLVHALMQIYDHNQLLAHPALGSSWESFALEQVIGTLGLREDQCFTWSLQSGAEMDLVFRQEGQLYGIEFKHTDTPRTTRSFSTAFEQLDLKAAAIVHGGSKSWSLGEDKFAISIQELSELKSHFGLT